MKKLKIDFQDGPYGSHLRFPIRTILAISDLQVALTLPTKFQVGSREKVQNRFSRWRPSWILDQLDFSYFLDLQVAPIFPPRFQVNLPFGSSEVQNRFSRWQPWWPSWISDLNN